jgi:hypothetical protein
MTELEKIPGVGGKLADELRLLGYQQAGQLKGQDPEQMYQKLVALHGHHIDRCVLYVFRCAVYFASNTVHDPAKLKWWYWKDQGR